MAFVSDSFTDTDGTALASHTGETGASWTKHGSYSGAASTISSNRLRGDGSAYCVHYASGTPASADYEVSADFHKISATGGTDDGPGVEGRRETTGDTCYLWQHYEGDGTWYLLKIVTGGVTTLGTYVSAISVGTPKAGKLTMTGSAIKGYVDGVERVSVSDSAITAAGRAAARTRKSGATTGYHLDNFDASDPAAAFDAANFPHLAPAVPQRRRAAMLAY